MKIFSAAHPFVLSFFFTNPEACIRAASLLSTRLVVVLSQLSYFHSNMGAVLQCMFRVCCDGDDDDDEEEDDHHSRSASHEHPADASSSLLLSTNNNNTNSNSDTYQLPPPPPQQAAAAAQLINNDEQEEEETRPHSHHARGGGGGLFRLFRPRFHKRAPSHKDDEDDNLKLSVNSPLRTACQFHSTGSYPTLSPHEIVLPGSKLQHEMAHIMNHLRYPEDNCSIIITEECIICLEGFDDSNPRIPTQCGCGTNQTYFHLPCLYQWIDQSGEECPTCRQAITWREFC